MSAHPDEIDLARVELAQPLETEASRSCGVHSWWLDTACFPTPKAAGMRSMPNVPRLPQSVRRAELLYVGRARCNLGQRITGQHLRRTRSSALRRTLLAVLLLADSSWREGAALDGRNRLVLAPEGEERLTTWMQRHLYLGWETCSSKNEVDDLEKRWICDHQPALNTDGTGHGTELNKLEQALREGLPTRS